jgi:hypothetical protein
MRDPPGGYGYLSAIRRPRLNKVRATAQSIAPATNNSPQIVFLTTLTYDVDCQRVNLPTSPCPTSPCNGKLPRRQKPVHGSMPAVRTQQHNVSEPKRINAPRRSRADCRHCCAPYTSLRSSCKTHIKNEKSTASLRPCAQKPVPAPIIPPSRPIQPAAGARRSGSVTSAPLRVDFTSQSKLIEEKEPHANCELY